MTVSRVGSEILVTATVGAHEYQDATTLSNGGFVVS